MLKKYKKNSTVVWLFFVLCTSISLLSQTVLPQSATLANPTRVDSVESNGSVKRNQWRGREILKQIKDAIKDRYYDPKYHGIDIDARFKKAEEEIEKAEFNGQIFGIIAQVVLEFNDSHTRFSPPNRANLPMYGFATQMIGNDCFVIRVDKDSDAEKKGLKVGDIVTSFGPYKPTRNNHGTIDYILYRLNPQESLSLTVLDENNKERKIEMKTDFKSIATRTKEDFKRGTVNEETYKCAEINSKIAACKPFSFSVDRTVIDKIMKFAGKYENLILDLRGNGGGYVHIEEYLVGHFFDKDVKVGNFVTRKKSEERIAKYEKDNSFKENW